MPSLSPLRLRCGTALAGLALLSGCATLPSSGPTAADVKRGAQRGDSGLQFDIVDIDAPVVQRLTADNNAHDGAVATLASLGGVGRNDVVGPGDVLAISLFEVGVSLFSGQRGDSNGLYDPTATNQTFPAIIVDRFGSIVLPYIGRLNVAGRTPAEIQEMINRGMRGKSQSPQSIVVLKESLSATVYVAGDVRRPGRFPLTLQRERLLDAIALAGGVATITSGGMVSSSEDAIVRFNRGSRTIEERLGRIHAGAVDDLQLLPGDRIELIIRPRTFIVLGATPKIAQMPFESSSVSLAEAVARAGGPADVQADPSAVFLFRYGSDAADPAAKPVIYRLNMMRPASYFLAQRIEMRDKDVIYIANAAANRPAKLIGIINQLFAPLIAAKVLTDSSN